MSTSIDIVLTLTQTAQFVVQSSDSDTPFALLALGPAGAVATYWAIFKYYRNTDKSHQFEKETLIEARPVEGGEDKVDHIGRTRKKSIAGKNGDDFRKRVQRVH